MYSKIPYVFHGYASPFFVGSLVTQETFYVNPAATEMFGIDSKNADFTKLFNRDPSCFTAVITDCLKTEKTCLLHNYMAKKQDGTEILVDLQLGYFNEEKTEIFLEIFPQNPDMAKLVTQQVNDSPRPAGILDYDETFRFHLLNQRLYHLLGCERHQDLEAYDFAFANAITHGNSPEQKSPHHKIQEIKEALDTQNHFYLELEIQTVTGEKKWISLTLEKKEYEDGSTKALCYLQNIENKFRDKGELDTLNRYLTAMERITGESFYRVDIQKRILNQRGVVAKELGLDLITEGYPENVYHIMHPEDLPLYKQFAQDILDGNSARLEMRVKDKHGVYHWYEKEAVPIYDDNGDVVEIAGKMNNIHHKKLMEEQVSTLHQYMEAVQFLSGESLYYVDLETRILRQKGAVAIELGMPEEVPNYPEGAYAVIHPDDLDKFKQFSSLALQGIHTSVELRVMTATKEYQWYEIIATKICDPNGNMIELFGRMTNIQNKHNLEATVAENHKYLSAMQEFSQDILYRVEVPTMTLYHSFESEVATRLGKVIPDYLNYFIQHQIIHPDDVANYLSGMEAWLLDDSQVQEARFAIDTEEYQWYAVKGKQIYDDKGNFVEFVGTLVNIDKEKNMEADYSTLNQYFTAMQNLSEDILFHIDLETQTFFHNEVNIRKYGYPSDVPEFMDSFVENGFVQSEDIPEYRENMKKVLRREINSFEARLLSVNQEFAWHEIRCEPVPQENGEVNQLFGRLRNIQGQKNLENRAYHDLMTGALNKVSFEEESEKILLESPITQHHALVFIDLDDFKCVNDSLGHRCGDALLTVVGNRLKSMIRGNDLVGRIGGDEFAVFLRDVDEESSAVLRTHFILAELQKSFSYDEHPIDIKASVGLALFPQHGDNYSKLIHKADLAVYQSKKRGKNVVSLYQEED